MTMHTNVVPLDATDQDSHVAGTNPFPPGFDSENPKSKERAP
jgi:hypothetical protein